MAGIDLSRLDGRAPASVLVVGGGGGKTAKKRELEGRKRKGSRGQRRQGSSNRLLFLVAALVIRSFPNWPAWQRRITLAMLVQ